MKTGGEEEQRTDTTTLGFLKEVPSIFFEKSTPATGHRSSGTVLSEKKKKDLADAKKAKTDYLEVSAA